MQIGSWVESMKQGYDRKHGDNRMENDFQIYIDQIGKIFPFPIMRMNVHTSGEEFLVIEINSEWMFRFPRIAASQKTLEKDVLFLSLFNSMSPLRVPDYRHRGDGFAGYLKVPGNPLNLELFHTLSESARDGLAGQIGNFLSALHNFPLKDAIKVGVTQAWDGNHHKNGRVFLENVTPHLSSSVRAKSISCMEGLLAEEFDSKVIHGDLYFPDHVFYDENEQQLGVIDFADVTLYDPAHDFQCVVEIGGESFFEAVMKHYEAGQDEALLKRSKMRLAARPLFVAGYIFANGPKNEYPSRLARVEESFSKV